MSCTLKLVGASITTFHRSSLELQLLPRVREDPPMSLLQTFSQRLPISIEVHKRETSHYARENNTTKPNQ